MKVLLGLERETKGALLYKELDTVTKRPIVSQYDGSIGNLYIRKTSEVGKQMPTIIEVEVKAHAG